MTRAWEVYASTLALFAGSDVLTESDRELQDILDREHALADPDFKAALAERKKLTDSLTV
jgi:hypothetical protein